MKSPPSAKIVVENPAAAAVSAMKAVEDADQRAGAVQQHPEGTGQRGVPSRVMSPWRAAATPGRRAPAPMPLNPSSALIAGVVQDARCGYSTQSRIPDANATARSRVNRRVISNTTATTSIVSSSAAIWGTVLYAHEPASLVAEKVEQ